LGSTPELDHLMEQLVQVECQLRPNFELVEQLLMIPIQQVQLRQLSHLDHFIMPLFKQSYLD
jgi:hypothetical protein